uniref:Proteasomal ubiquitin receptor ADRM1 homolog n=1 Tax=Timema tahoe TaxID=61484 RepID=A0A7R9IJN9_9NEOP|nr:unnamed protein product [Timema tahoe]
MPSGAALFGNTASRSQNKNLVEFKAGRMDLKGKMVHPDKRKGLIYVYQSSDDSLLHFCWKDRQSGSVEDDLIVFPDDCEFKKIAQCTTGRVYLLKFKSTSRKFFYWLQESKPDKDEDLCRRVNEVLNNPPTPGAQRSTPDGDLQNLLNNMSQQQLMQLFGGVGQIGGLSSLLGTMSRPSTSSRSSSSASASPSVTSAPTTTSTTSSTPAAASVTTPAATVTNTSTPLVATETSAKKTSSGGSQKTPIQLSDLQNLLSSLNVPVAPGASKSVDLAPAMTSENLADLLRDGDALSFLKQFLPKSGEGSSESSSTSGEQLDGVLKSPFFQQHGYRFSHSCCMSCPDHGYRFSHSCCMSCPKHDLDSPVCATCPALITVIDSPIRAACPALITVIDSSTLAACPAHRNLQYSITLTMYVDEHEAVSMFSAALQSGQLGPIMSQFDLGAEAIEAAKLGNMEEFVKAMEQACTSKDVKTKLVKKDDDDDDESMSLD